MVGRADELAEILREDGIEVLLDAEPSEARPTAEGVELTFETAAGTSTLSGSHLLVAAGPLGGPRIAVFDGASLLAGNAVKLFADFFVFEPGLRDGVYLAAGDLDGRKEI